MPTNNQISDQSRKKKSKKRFKKPALSSPYTHPEKPQKIEGDDGKPHYPNEIYEEQLPPETQLK